MPAITAPSTVLVTGANGYIAAHTVKALLDDGFSVRGTVRSRSKGEYLKNLFVSYGDRFEVVVVPDLTEPTAHDEAVKGVSAIIHLASPLPKHVDDANEIAKPIVDGTLGLLESARKYAPTVKRVVVTSTIFAAMEPKEGEYTYSEEDWNDALVNILQEQGSKTNGLVTYGASKVLEERAAFDFVAKHHEEITFDVTTILPSWVFGPMIHELGPLESLPFTSFKVLYLGLTNTPATNEPLDWRSVEGYIDVRDTAELHVLALITEAAANQRFFSVAGNFDWQDAYDALNKEPAFQGAYVGSPGTGKERVFEKKYSNAKVDELFHFKYRPFEDTIRDSWVEFERRGWIQH
ncbi:methylglyoxal reductase (NADPH-dependent) gre2 [Tulasnella sp. 403]|nr:methylglyoxal reductase (NADPH-dependent) gre2 [Tulasnella sp. 403]